ncbi:MAG: Asp-tRNA(Asn)/Glu-tRNA(Gln) amidotransferase subunit GatB [Elusimicrobiota bacterium]|nr:Asp-tRNA(Asn)/Glu-tRNA(Gln) amidotransferase subunit GatB [Elusimicrobiota bacterium]
MTTVSLNAKFLPVIGLEVHVQLKTKTKLFCRCSVEYGVESNKNICPVCTGQPGVLPVLNKKAVELALKAAVALNCKISAYSIFARKNYFYPDLPKNYQISQYEQPLATDGFVEIEIGEDKKITKRVYIKRIHLEEDAGKLLHAIGKEELDYSLVDYNRTGTPLIEIVTQPCIHSPEEAVEYLETLRNILRYIDVSDCDMEKGTFRVDANLSLATVDANFSPDDYTKIPLGTKTELKNMNSFKAIKEALSYEIMRQRKILSSGGKVIQETRLWDDITSTTQSMRRKEEAHDYRYFPEPDLLPLEISDEWIKGITQQIPELPNKKKNRFKHELGLSDYDSEILVSDKTMAEFFDETIKIYIKNYDVKDIKSVAKTVSNIIITELLGLLNKENKTFKENKISPQSLAELVKIYNDEILSSKLLKEVFYEMWETSKTPYEIVREKNMVQITDENELISIISEVINENPKVVADYKSGKEQAISALIGQVMRKTKGRANPKRVQELFKKLLS